jgi:hypothetical protein
MTGQLGDFPIGGSAIDGASGVLGDAGATDLAGDAGIAAALA